MAQDFATEFTQCCKDSVLTVCKDNPADSSPQKAMAQVPIDQLAPETKDELAVSYAALILHDDGAEITPAGMNALLKAAVVSVEAYWPALFAKMIKTQGMDSLLAAGGGGSGGGGGGGGGGAAAGGEAAGGGGGAEKKEEKKV